MKHIATQQFVLDVKVVSPLPTTFRLIGPLSQSCERSKMMEIFDDFKGDFLLGPKKDDHW